MLTAILRLVVNAVAFAVSLHFTWRFRAIVNNRDFASFKSSPPLLVLKEQAKFAIVGISFASFGLFMVLLEAIYWACEEAKEKKRRAQGASYYAKRSPQASQQATGTDSVLVAIKEE